MINGTYQELCDMLAGVDCNDSGNLAVIDQILHNTSLIVDEKYQTGDGALLSLAQRAVDSMNYRLVDLIFSYTKHAPQSVSIDDLIKHDGRLETSSKHRKYVDNIEQFIQLFAQYIPRESLQEALRLAISVENIFAENALNTCIFNPSVKAPIMTIVNTFDSNIEQNKYKKYFGKNMLDAIKNDQLLEVRSILDLNSNTLGIPIYYSDAQITRTAPAIFWACHFMRGKIVRYLSTLYDDPQEYLNYLPTTLTIMRRPYTDFAKIKNEDKKEEMLDRFEESIDDILSVVSPLQIYSHSKANVKNLQSALKKLASCDMICSVQAYIKFGLPVPTLLCWVSYWKNVKTSASCFVEGFLHYLEENNDSAQGVGFEIYRELFLKRQEYLERQSVYQITQIRSDFEVGGAFQRMCDQCNFEGALEYLQGNSMSVDDVLHAMSSIMGDVNISNVNAFNDIVSSLLIEMCVVIKNSSCDNIIEKVALSSQVAKKIARTEFKKLIDNMLEIKHVYSESTFLLICKYAVQHRSFQLFYTLIDHLSAHDVTKLIVDDDGKGSHSLLRVLCISQNILAIQVVLKMPGIDINAPTSNAHETALEFVHAKIEKLKSDKKKCGTREVRVLEKIEKLFVDFEKKTYASATIDVNSDNSNDYNGNNYHTNSPSEKKRKLNSQDDHINKKILLPKVSNELVKENTSLRAEKMQLQHSLKEAREKYVNIQKQHEEFKTLTLASIANYCTKIEELVMENHDLRTQANDNIKYIEELRNKIQPNEDVQFVFEKQEDIFFSHDNTFTSLNVDSFQFMHNSERNLICDDSLFNETFFNES